MPSSTFQKLNTKKKERFLSAAKQQFANGFESASISQLVKELGIAKGSVYQYFEDKLDLYHYLVMQAYEKRLMVTNLIDRQYHKSVDDWLIKRCVGEVHFARELAAEQQLLTHSYFNPIGEEDRKIHQDELTQLSNYLKEISRIKGLNFEAIAYTFQAFKNKLLTEASNLNDTDIVNRLSGFLSIRELF